MIKRKYSQPQLLLGLVPGVILILANAAFAKVVDPTFNPPIWVKGAVSRNQVIWKTVYEILNLDDAKIADLADLKSELKIDLDERIDIQREADWYRGDPREIDEQIDLAKLTNRVALKLGAAFEKHPALGDALKNHVSYSIPSISAIARQLKEQGFVVP